MKMMILSALLSLSAWAHAGEQSPGQQQDPGQGQEQQSPGQGPEQQAPDQGQNPDQGQDQTNGSRHCSCNSKDDRHWRFYAESCVSAEDAAQKALYKCAIRSDMPASCEIDTAQFCGCY